MEVQILASEVSRRQKEGRKGKGREDDRTYTRTTRMTAAPTFREGSGDVGSIAPAQQKLDRYFHHLFYA